MSAAERRRFLANIAADAERLSQLVTRLLDLARADMAVAAEARRPRSTARPLRRADAHARRRLAVDLDAGRPAAGRRAAPLVETVLNPARKQPPGGRDRGRDRGASTRRRL